MLSEDFDKRIRDAADHHHPAYDEKAWAGMKKLLDKHMPEEKEKKRRFIFILLFPLLLAGIAWLLVDRLSGNHSNGKPLAADTQPLTTKNTNTQPVVNEQPVAAIPAGQAGNTVSGQSATDVHTDKSVIPVNTSTTRPVANNNSAGPALQENKTGIELSVSGGQKKQKNKKQPVTSPSGNEPAEKNKNNTDADNTVAISTSPVSPVTTNVSGNIPAENKITESVAKPVDKNIPVTDNTTKAQPKPTAVEERKVENAVTKNQKPLKKKSNFFFAVSAAPDVSFTGNDKPGTMKVTGGIGIGYTYKERFTLRTGIYTGRKIYTSSPAEYHMSSWLASYYPNLQKVGADCKVYEVPILLSYNFGAAKKHNWFASAGISSLFMKQETYDYFYKYYPAGPTVNRSYTIKNQNNHPFSILTLSAGYQLNLSKHISFLAEPYFKAPLTGVGAGKVKLNSTGLSFTIAVSPFQPAKKK